ncbi:uncharacterized protein [Oscarella lobularis]|uniref:uncharacterized protein isoform X2 n=1 Tax=Oscarella lobularis TaxID=121494 RepID=UPI00331319C4
MTARRIFVRAVLFFWSLNVSIVIGQESYISPLQSKIEAMQDQLNAVMSAFPTAGSTPVAHVYGQFSGKYTSSLLKPWKSHGSLSQPSFLAGGMTFVDDGIVVPFTGLYYVYGQLQLDPHSGDTTSGCQFYLDPGSSRDIWAWTISKTKTGSEDHTKYTGAIRLLNQGDVIRMYVYYCTLDYSHLGETFLGAFFVSFNFLDNDGPPVTNSFYSYSSGSRSNGSVFSWHNHVLSHGGASSSYRGLNIPKRGLYFVFGQQTLDPQSSNEDCGFWLQQDNSNSRLASTYIRSFEANYDDRTEYTGLAANLSAGQYLRMHAWFGCYFTSSTWNYIGAFYLPFQNGPTVHLIGNLSGTYIKGTTLTGGWSPTMMNGNMKLDRNGFIVPTDGIYYIYAQIHMTPTTSSMKHCAYELRSTSSSGPSVIATGVSFVPSPAKRDKVVYTGAATRLSAGSVVYVRMRGTCLLRYIGGKEQFLGGFYLGHSSGYSL